MALRTVGLIRDQNINVHYNGKENMATAPRKGGIGGRKPLSDLQNSVNWMTLNKENSKILSFTEKETTVSKLTHDSSKKKSVDKALEKPQVGGRKALCDISNSGKPNLKETSKKSQTSKFTILAENPIEPEDIAKEGFLHNHDGCVNAQKKTISNNEFLQILGLEDFSKPPASAKGTHMPNEMPMSPLRNFEAKEMTDLLIEDWSPPKHKMSTKLNSAPPSPGPMDCSMHWNDLTFELIGSP
ncbi:protein PATRONUS 2 isoform X2 [Hibiscus syriacus]|uniref:protein PATRONUS 2 isoform X2 n=1 Tax=Hibiscus syriacus TaxID=106335 RepID=UPI00192459EB|nr:protein PATRONUS 2 isoform X2 [Hibiscus syriacus]XP_039010128.1 protein PATRONUS 2 isoform X2 [Hibiscus syriacus]XP_039010129.1 protein PATRONUS 2 isoform X2 [Hibiscus syriacus]